MRCPRCAGPTHVIEHKSRGLDARRRRGCGQLRGGKLVGRSCGLRFSTIELPVGASIDIGVKLTIKGFEVELKEKTR